MTFVIVTKWAYPYGGGEEFMHQTMEFTSKISDCIWLCFNNARNEPFAQTKVVNFFPCPELKYVNAMICVAGGFTERKLYCWLRMIKPLMIHTQGALRLEIETVARVLNIPLMSGFHFWHGAVLLSEKHNNVRILENINTHRVDPNFPKHVLQRADVVYGPSIFFNDVIQKITGLTLELLPPMPTESQVIAEKNMKQDKLFENDDWQLYPRGYVTVINIHESKGGRLFYYLLQHLDEQIPLLGIRTDVFTTDLDVQIDTLCKRRQNAFISPRIHDIRRLYKRTGILLQASECDETFCRVLVEAHVNGVATLSSDYGNLPYLHLTDTAKKRCIIHGNTNDIGYFEKWVQKIKEKWYKDGADLSTSVVSSDSLSQICATNYLNLKKEYDVRQLFFDLIKLTIERGEKRKKRVALFAPWCDQGLGIQTRNYAIMLRDAGFKVFIFSFQPYTGQREQANSDEWRIPDIDVYYSPHHRESVLKTEILAFALRTRITKAIIAETCWHRVFSMMAELKSANINIYAVPNVEIVRCDEIEKHLVFDKILLNNKLCEKLFTSHGFPVSKLWLTSYSISADVTNLQLNSSLQKPQQIVLLILGGRNAVSRKHVDIAIKGFLSAMRRWKVSSIFSLKLVATSQILCPELIALKEEISQSNGHIELIFGNLSAESISQLYQKCHIVIQISKHEGLGIGFFEALAVQKPIITLNIEPHNECAPKEVAWYIEPDKMIPNIENNSCGIFSASVGVEKMETFFVDFAKEVSTSEWWQQQYLPKQTQIRTLVAQRHNYFKQRFFSALQD